VLTGSTLLRIAPVARHASLAGRASTTTSAKRFGHSLRDEVVAPVRASWERREQPPYQSPESHGVGLPRVAANRVSDDLCGRMPVQPLGVLLGRRHGAFLAVETDGALVPLEAHPTLTRFGSERVFADLERRLVSGDAVPEPSRYGVGVILIATRVESGRVVRRIRVPLGEDDDPTAGVREPRRPPPRGSPAEARACQGRLKLTP
jgi:hypothetical protein